MSLALDTSTGSSDNSGSATSLTFSHTCTGSNLILLVAISTNGSTDRVTGVTYNGVSLTRIGQAANAGTQPVSSYLYYLINPATGAHNVIVSMGSGSNVAADSISYTGAKQSGQPDASGTNNSNTGTTLDLSATVVATGCWLLSTYWNLNARTQPASTTARGTNSMTADSNGTVATGSNTHQWSTSAAASAQAGIIASIAPAQITSSSVSPSISPSRSLSPSASQSPSASLSPSSSSSASQSPSRSLSPSASQSPSSSISASLSPSSSASSSVSASRSPSSSPSNSPSASPSAGFSDYTRGAPILLPADATDLLTHYTEQEEIDVSTRDGILVGQVGTLEYMIHQFKSFVGSESYAMIIWVGQSNLAPKYSTVYLQVFNRHTSLWETLDSDAESDEIINFELVGVINDLTNYKDPSNIIASRVYQLAL